MNPSLNHYPGVPRPVVVSKLSKYVQRESC